MNSPTIDQLVSRFLSGEDLAMVDAILLPDACPESAWSAILRIMGHDLSEAQQSLLAAGPIEGLLVWHGERFIDRIEAEARRSSDFVKVLRGVWRQNMPENIWHRLELARGDGGNSG